MASDDPKVNFVVAGAQKSGTTALRHFLSQHPQIGVPKDGVSETHYFSRRYVSSPQNNYDMYHSLYEPEALKKVTGDITPVYIYLESCLDRIRDYNPDMKIIVLLRDPVARAHSQWVMENKRGTEPLGFFPALWQEARCALRSEQHLTRSYIRRGFYGRQLCRLFDIFPREQCLILLSDALSQQHDAALRQVFGFLEVDVEKIPPHALVHTNEYTPLHPWLAKALRLLYRRDLKRVEQLTGIDVSDWRK